MNIEHGHIGVCGGNDALIARICWLCENQAPNVQRIYLAACTHPIIKCHNIHIVILPPIFCVCSICIFGVCIPFPVAKSTNLSLSLSLYPVDMSTRVFYAHQVINPRAFWPQHTYTEPVRANWKSVSTKTATGDETAKEWEKNYGFIFGWLPSPLQMININTLTTHNPSTHAHCRIVVRCAWIHSHRIFRLPPQLNYIMLSA